MTTYLGETARDFTIAEARRLQIQAVALAGDASDRSEKIGQLAARLAALQDEVKKVLEQTLDAVVAANATAVDLRAEADKLEAIKARLEQDKAAGKPFPIEITLA